VVLAVGAAACRLSLAEAVEANAIAGPLCASLGPDLAPVPFVGPFSGLIALICPAVEQEIVAAETVEPVDAGAPAPVASVPDGGALTDAGAPVLAAAPRRHAHFKVDPHCVATPIPGDPLHQWACPELHALILAAEKRAIIREQQVRARGVRR